MGKVDPPELITQAEYARRRAERGLPGGTKEAVRKAVQTGRISAIGVDKLIDPRVADIQWERNTRHRATATAATASSALPMSLDEAQPSPDPAEDPDGPDAPSQGGSGTSPNPYQDARTRIALADAEKAERENLKEAGKLIYRAAAEKAVRDYFRALRDRVLTVPRRAAPAAIGLTDVREIEAAYTKYLVEAFAQAEDDVVARIMLRAQGAGQGAA